MNRCGHCDNCRHVEATKRIVLATANPPFSHADNGTVEMWNKAVKDHPCSVSTQESA